MVEGHHIKNNFICQNLVYNCQYHWRHKSCRVLSCVPSHTWHHVIKWQCWRTLMIWKILSKTWFCYATCISHISWYFKSPVSVRWTRILWEYCHKHRQGKWLKLNHFTFLQQGLNSPVLESYIQACNILCLVLLTSYMLHE